MSESTLADDLESQLEGIEVPEVPRVRKQKVAKKETAPTVSNHVEIIIAEGGPDEAADVFVGVQGRGMLIKRGVRVSVPREVLSILNSAVTGVLVKVGVRPDGGDEEELRFRPRFPYQIVG